MATLAIVSMPSLMQSKSTVGSCLRCISSRRPLHLAVQSNERTFRRSLKKRRTRATASTNNKVSQFPGAKEVYNTEEWKALEEHVGEMKGTHLRELLKDEDRCRNMILSMPTRQSVEEGGFQPVIFLDYSRQLVSNKTMELLFKLAERANLREKIDAMFSGVHVNNTENRAVMHAALRAPRDEIIQVDGKNVVPDVWEVLDRIKTFSEEVRSGQRLGVTGKKLTNIVAIGIGGSYLGPLFVHTALRTGTHRMPRSAPELEYQSPQKSAEGRKLRFLANVDPIDVSRALSGLDAEETLVIVISKTFTTAETMLNARTVRAWITSRLGEDSVSKHMVAVSTNVEKVAEFGIDPDNAFPFWDWVGGRYSVCSAVGMLPLSIQYGWDNMNRFLEGAHSVDKHMFETRFERNLPVLMGLLSIWNSSFLNYGARAILPYCQALAKFPAHIQQVSMESNGKSVDIHGEWLPFQAGEVDFGEPGTNGQHSFYQLIHQGRVVPAEFIGLVKSQQSVYLKGETVSNHDELMSNFFAQADALAYGKTKEELEAEGTAPELIPHKTFSGNRPSMSLMLPALDPYTVGQLLSLYENRIAVQGFVWGINSFDQWGVELGKTLAVKIRKQLNKSRTEGEAISSEFNYSTRFMLQHYLEGKQRLLYPEPRDFFPCELIPEADNCIASFEDSL